MLAEELILHFLPLVFQKYTITQKSLFSLLFIQRCQQNLLPDLLVLLCGLTEFLSFFSKPNIFQTFILIRGKPFH